MAGQNTNPPIEDQIYVVQAKVVNVGSGAFVGLQDKNGVQYSVWNNEGNEGAYNEAADSEGYICDIAYNPKGQYKNVVKVKKVKKMVAEVSPAQFVEGETSSKQTAIEAQVCLKKACDMVAARPELFFDEPKNISDDVLFDRLADISTGLASVLLDTIDYLEGNVDDDNVEEGQMAEEAPEEIPESDYVEEEVKIAPEKPTVKAAPSRRKRK